MEVSLGIGERVGVFFWIVLGGSHHREVVPKGFWERL